MIAMGILLDSTGKEKFVMTLSRPLFALALAATLAFGSAGCAKDQRQQANEPRSDSKTERDPLRVKIEEMPLKQKLGQMIIAGLEGTDIDEHTKSLIADDRIGGFILYKPNIESTEQTVALLNGLKEANRSNSVPLLLSVDQEGGRVNRLPSTFAAIPSSRDIGKSGSAQKARAFGESIGEQLRAFGFNMNFAPVLDVDSNPDNPVIGSRSFGSTASVVSSFGIEEMLGLRSKGVVPVVKHFPGHGDTSVDSHLELPVVDKTSEQLRKLELVPFSDAIRSNADAIMIAHILLPKIDPDSPSSMSSKVITGLLRGELGYDGIVMTDDMTMGAIVKHMDVGSAAVRSVKAGSDIILVAHEYGQVKKAIDALVQAAEAGNIPKEQIDRSVYRILSLKERYSLKDTPSGPVDVEKINAALKAAAGK
jgi:beta-N-acetylhexosaminidase